MAVNSISKDEKGKVVGECVVCKGKVIKETPPSFDPETQAPTRRQITYHCGSCGLAYHFPPPSAKKATKKAKGARVKKPVAPKECCPRCGERITRGKFLGHWFPPLPHDIRNISRGDVLTNWCPALPPDKRGFIEAASLPEAERILGKLGFGTCVKCDYPHVPKAYGRATLRSA